MKRKALVLSTCLILIFLISTNTFAIPTVGDKCTGTKIDSGAKCAFYGVSTTCPNHWFPGQGDAHGLGQCQYGHVAGSATKCTTSLSPGGADPCWYGTCTNTTTGGGGICTGAPCSASETACENCAFSVTGSVGKNCRWDATPIPLCVSPAGGYCKIPEFMGIEYGEMNISTGIIALITAIALPTFLFRKRN
ncbi:MAG: hypothetical protein CL943_02185 [Candidatus Diapherotrites archaeon]|uniref:Uncharacterized protein n=1 Tax=Candidatus Iainarchaeum sp. TaxID=3101447 RepID=A0A2D6M0Y4_9ARCH|nr:hypothetical protein [Candidatus Diapherotrites archaeon]|tara:strand:+ start:2090 stop:2665 length:576 start_codon:yes stop_codon:yes gene_type:complete